MNLEFLTSSSSECFAQGRVNYVNSRAIDAEVLFRSASSCTEEPCRVTFVNKNHGVISLS